MAINEYTPEQKKAIDFFMPAVNQAVRKVAEAPGGDYFITAFIFKDDPDNPILIHAGNVPVRGEELIRTHYVLSCSAAELDIRNLLQRSEIKSAPEGQTPEEIADKLVVSLLGGIPDGASDEIQDLIQKYLQSRKR